jgi:hypothetical protein
MELFMFFIFTSEDISVIYVSSFEMILQWHYDYVSSTSFRCLSGNYYSDKLCNKLLQAPRFVSSFLQFYK